MVSVDYRLGPEDPYPAAVEDAVLSLQWLSREGTRELGIDMNRLVVGGSSRLARLSSVY